MLPPYLALSINRSKYGSEVTKWNYQRTNLPLKSSLRGNTYCYMCASCQASWLCANYIIQDIMFWDWWTTRTIKEGWPWLLCDLTETVVYFLFCHSVNFSLVFIIKCCHKLYSWIQELIITQHNTYFTFVKPRLLAIIDGWLLIFTTVLNIVRWYTLHVLIMSQFSSVPQTLSLYNNSSFSKILKPK